jgi:hypothetical protein
MKTYGGVQKNRVRFEISTAVTIKNAVFWDVSLQPPAHAGSSLADFSTLKMEAISSSEKSVYTISTRRHIQQDGILQRENSFTH